MQTKQIYYENQYKKTLSTKIISVEVNVSMATVILSETIFYPEGGGQPSDQGVIIGDNGKLEVQQVIIRDGEILHIGKITGNLNPGESVDSSIDWDRRYLNMRTHSAGHIVNDATLSLFPELVPISGEHGKKAYIKYKGHLDQVSFAVILEKANEIISSNLNINTEFVSLDQLKERATFIPDNLPKNKPLRIMQIGSYSVIPDGGTQVKKTGEIESVTQVNITNEGEFTYVNYKIKEIQGKDKLDVGELSPVFSSNIDSNEIINLKSQYVSQIIGTKDVNELEQVRIDLFGKNGKFTLIAKQIKDVAPASRAQFGILINETKKTLESLIEEQKSNLKQTVRTWFDPTIPSNKIITGKTHFVTQAIDEISSVFEKIGFTRSRYPEVEWDYYAFGALNFPENHPARDDWETFFLDFKSSKKYGAMLLTPHTSSGQIREMETNKPPIRMINIAKCYRRQIDVSHYPMFHQFEGLVVDKNISITHLRGTIDYFAKTFFGPDRITRLRPYHFQFTEPSFEVDISCNVCGGTGKISANQNCKLCKEGWLEIGGAGMVHPNVLKNCQIDSKIYSGFAFGWGVERTYMMKSGLAIPDVRLLYSTDVRVLSQI